MTGEGYSDKAMKQEEAALLIRKALQKESLRLKRVLLIVPDYTRTAPVPLFYKTVFDEVSSIVKSVDVLIALGTHRPMTFDEILKHVGLTKTEYREKYESKSKFYNHTWDKPETLATIGTIYASEAETLTEGIIKRDVDITINKRIFDYDHIMVFGPVFPHEIVGFSGGNKYFFPGICGIEINNMFHWIGAMITNAVINGIKDTPVRRTINRAAQFIQKPKTYFNIVVSGDDIHGIYIGDDIKAWGKAVDLSAKVNIKYVDHQYKTVVGVATNKYDEIWTAGKVAYKVETIVEDGGSVIIYAPHITEFSATFGHQLEEIGFHCKDYYLENMDDFVDKIPEYTMSIIHSTTVRGSGECKNGIEKPRINVVLATGISKERCEKVNLGYMDYNEIDINSLKENKNDEILFIPDGGETLYKVKR